MTRHRSNVLSRSRVSSGKTDTFNSGRMQIVTRLQSKLCAMCFDRALQEKEDKKLAKKLQEQEESLYIRKFVQACKKPRALHSLSVSSRQSKPQNQLKRANSFTSDRSKRMRQDVPRISTDHGILLSWFNPHMTSGCQNEEINGVLTNFTLNSKESIQKPVVEKGSVDHILFTDLPIE